MSQRQEGSELVVGVVVLCARHVVLAVLHLDPCQVGQVHDVRHCDAVLLGRPHFENGVLVGQLRRRVRRGRDERTARPSFSPRSSCAAPSADGASGCTCTRTRAPTPRSAHEAKRLRVNEREQRGARHACGMGMREKHEKRTARPSFSPRSACSASDCIVGLTASGNRPATSSCIASAPLAASSGSNGAASSPAHTSTQTPHVRIMFGSGLIGIGEGAEGER
jgi:hypothetical protein